MKKILKQRQVNQVYNDVFFDKDKQVSKINFVIDFVSNLRSKFLILNPPLLDEKTKLTDDKYFYNDELPTIPEFKKNGFSGFDVMIYYILSYGEKLGLNKAKASRYFDNISGVSFKDLTNEEKKKVVNLGDRIVFNKMDLLATKEKALVGLYGKVTSINKDNITVTISDSENENNFVYEGLKVSWDEIEEVIKN